MSKRLVFTLVAKFQLGKAFYLSLQIICPHRDTYVNKRRSSGSRHVGSNYVASRLLRHFWAEGPNGGHLVLALPVYGPSISHMSRWTTIGALGRPRMSGRQWINIDLRRISREEAESLCDLLSKVLIYEPVQRISVEELTRHPWSTTKFGDEVTFNNAEIHVIASTSCQKLKRAGQA